ncbi:hypothetical protein JAAARDRAFT_54580 [Jaapia argillacea MUCL 33604]|uniref:Gelsolin-like domain-containing protein n=1 Tax=Jaapia argillacea MUCL 33604 TaxID=933084 RepID=A0A067Q915_9AGAM|nr:hypothetical protein JAAARDRAFT_54580 [Jaapia argillacea MUCL 33604]
MTSLPDCPAKFDIDDTNIALLGSDLEKRVREHAGDKETAWQDAGLVPGIQIWRIEQFKVVVWPKERYGSFYDGDSYIVLHTYKKDPKSAELSFNLHFWLGRETTQDEAGVAAYKSVELDDHLDGVPVQYREVQGYESQCFISHFPRFVSLRGGVSTGFHHVSAPPEDSIHRLYNVSTSVFHSGTKTTSHLIVREVHPSGGSLVEGDVFVLDKGSKVWQFNTKQSVGKEKFKAAEFVQTLVSDRQGHAGVTVFDEGVSGAGTFLSELGLGAMPTQPAKRHQEDSERTRRLFRVSDADTQVTFEPVTPISRSCLSSQDAFLLDDVHHPTAPAVYVWIGKESSLKERRLVMQYAQKYLHDNREQQGGMGMAVSLVKINEGSENDAFLHAIEK